MIIGDEAYIVNIKLLYAFLMLILKYLSLFDIKVNYFYLLKIIYV